METMAMASPNKAQEFASVFDPIASAIERECFSLLSSLVEVSDVPVGLHGSVIDQALPLTSMAELDQQFSTPMAHDGCGCAETSLVLNRCSQASTAHMSKRA
jgi:hypothetical protein